MNLEKAMGLLSLPKKGRGKAAPLKEFGKHPGHDIEVQLLNGPYGVYIKAGKTNVSLPEGMTAELLTAEKAFDLISEKIGEGSINKTTGKKAAKKPTATKSAKAKAEVLGVKKVITKNTAAKKTVLKKKK